MATPFFLFKLFIQTSLVFNKKIYRWTLKSSRHWTTHFLYQNSQLYCQKYNTNYWPKIVQRCYPQRRHNIDSLSHRLIHIFCG